MVSDNTKKIFGIFIAIAMAGSLIAGGFIFMDPDQDIFAPPQTDLNLNSTPSTFNYQINFDTNVLSELNSIRVALETDSLNINEINSSIRELDFVNKITRSQFVKYKSGQYYFAEIDFKKNTDLTNAFNQISSLNYFTGFKEGMKRVTITVPETTKVKNIDLNIDRTFNFEYETSVALVSLSTQINDEINVSGEISLQGNTILNLELSETENFSNKPVTYLEVKTLPIIDLTTDLFFQGTISKDINQDLFTAKLKEIDQNSQLHFFEIGENLNFFGQTKIENQKSAEGVFMNANTINFSQSATFNLSEIFVKDLNTNINLDKNSFTTNVKPKKEIGENVTLELSIGVSRSGAEITNATELE